MSAPCPVEYDFYVNVFWGCAIEEKDFLRLSERAGEYVYALTRGLCANVPDENRETLKRAVCAVAEVIQDEERLARRAFAENRGVSKETVGNYSVSYDAAGPSGTETAFLEKRKKEAAMMYLSRIPALKELFFVRSFSCMHHIR